MRIAGTVMIILIMACNNAGPTIPKPRVFPRIEFPVKEYHNFNRADCPFTMKVPVYFDVRKDSTLRTDFPDSKCWFDLDSEALNASFHFSYLPVKNRKGFDALVEDAFEMADKHNVKANYREELMVSLPDKDVYGILFELDGPVAAPLQFFLTDSTRHFLRGSLYFNAQVDRDSVAPVYSFLKDDFSIMLESFSWAH